jgi:hypothetical protein
VRIRSRPLILTTAAVYALSLGLLLWASTLAVPIQAGQLTWQGIVDVAAALVVVLLGMALYARGRPVVDEWALRQSHLIATTVIVAALVAMWLAAERLHFDVLLPGLVWRLFALLQSLPATLALWRAG